MAVFYQKTIATGLAIARDVHGKFVDQQANNASATLDEVFSRSAFDAIGRIGNVLAAYSMTPCLAAVQFMKMKRFKKLFT